MIINSGYRTIAYDKKVGGDGKGYHTKGMAADIKAYDKNGKVISAKIVCQSGKTFNVSNKTLKIDK